jgi:two-component system response regulator QseB
MPTQLSVARTSALPNDHVLLALPPTATSASVLRSLRAEGVSVSAVADGIGVLDAVRARDPALVVLDVELPGPDQAAVLASIQSEAPHVAVIAVTPRSAAPGCSRCCAAIATTTSCAPSPSTSSPRASGLRLRLGPAVESTVLRQGELAVDTEFGEVSVEGTPVSLSPTEYSLLLALIGTPGEVVPPDRLAREVWSEPASSEPRAGLHLLPASPRSARSASDGARRGYVLEALERPGDIR